jgi:iron complex transport system substrate-binding protein
MPLSGSIEKSFTHDFIELGGGTNVVGDQLMFDVDREKILAANPEVIIIAIMGSQGGLAAEEQRNWQRFAGLQAVRDNRVHTIDPDLVCSPSPATFIEALTTITGLIHPDLNLTGQP